MEEEENLGVEQSSPMKEENQDDKIETEVPDDETNPPTEQPAEIISLVQRALRDDSTKKDVKNLYLKKDLLSEFDFSSPSVLHQMLAQSFSSFNFLTCPEGKKFLTFLMGLDMVLTAQCHSVVAHMLSNAHTTTETIKALAEVYFKAWKKCDSQDLRFRIELDCIQDFMFHAIHASSNQKGLLFRNLRQFLQLGFFSQKNDPQVDEMILRLMEPILFRSLKVANSTVRKHASTLLIDAFPLLDKEKTKEENEELKNSQLNYLEDMLLDVNPLIRCVGVEGVCKIATLFWEILPEEKLFNLLKMIATDISFDSVWTVRVSCLRGLTHLLKNHFVHGYLKKWLQDLKSLIHDKSTKVRIEMCNLLYAVKKVSGLRYFDIVPVEDINIRIAMDSQQIVRIKLSELVMNSYYPFHLKNTEIFKRFAGMLTTAPQTAKIFYSYVVKMVPPEETVKLVTILVGFLKKGIDDANTEVKKQITTNPPVNTITRRRRHKKPEENEEKPAETEEKSENKSYVELDAGEPSQTEEELLKKEKEAKSKQEKEEEDANKRLMKQWFENTKFVESLLEILIEIVEAALKHFEDEKFRESFSEDLKSQFSGPFLVELQTNFHTKSPKISSFVWGIAKFLDEDKISELSVSVISKLEKMCEQGEAGIEFKTLLECLIEWKHADKFIQFVETCLLEGANTISLANNTEDEPEIENNNKNTIRRRRRRRNVQVLDTNNPNSFKKPFLALIFLNHLLDDPKYMPLLTKIRSMFDKLIYDILEDKILNPELSELLLAEKECKVMQEQFIQLCFQTHSKLVMTLMGRRFISESFSKELSNPQKMAYMNKTFETKIPDKIEKLLNFYINTVVSAIYRAGSSDSFVLGTTRVKAIETPAPEKPKRRKRNRGSEKTEESSTITAPIEETDTERQFPHYPLSIYLVKTIFLTLHECLAAGYLRFSQKNVMTIISQLFYGLFHNQKTEEVISYSFFEVCNILQFLSDYFRDENEKDYEELEEENEKENEEKPKKDKKKEKTRRIPSFFTESMQNMLLKIAGCQRNEDLDSNEESSSSSNKKKEFFKKAFPYLFKEKEIKPEENEKNGENEEKMEEDEKMEEKIEEIGKEKIEEENDKKMEEEVENDDKIEEEKEENAQIEEENGKIEQETEEKGKIEAEKNEEIEKEKPQSSPNRRPRIGRKARKSITISEDEEPSEIY